MSSGALTGPFPGGARTGSEMELEEVPRSFWQQVVSDTFRTWRARAGSAWILLVVVAGVFAPFIANSYPLLLKRNGRWSSPLLAQLSGVDVLLPIALVAAAILVFLRRFTASQRLALWAWIMACLAPLVFWPALLPGLAPGEPAGTPWLIRFSAYQAFGYSALAGAAIAVMAVIVLVPLRLGVSARAKVVVAVAVLPAAILLVLLPVRPREAVVYQKYRDLERAGQVERIIRTVVPYSPTDRLRDEPGNPKQPPSREHPFGREGNGADVLSRMIHASRIALSIGLISTSIAVLIGVIIGGIMGYFAGRVDIIGMRLIEIFEAIPTLFLLITFVAFFGRNLYIMMAIIGGVTWTSDARFIRAEFLRLRKQDFVQAAVAAGLPLRSILFRHMLPNGIAPVLVAASFGVASAILAEATLSFLGLGLVDEPSWGQMLNQARGAGGAFDWWLAVFPGVAIFLTVFAYNLVGESLRDAIDPKIRKD